MISLPLLALLLSNLARQGLARRNLRYVSPYISHQQRGANGTTTANVTLSLSAPANKQTLDSNLVALSIEGDRWPDWAGVDRPNAFFLNCLSNLAHLSGSTPNIRVGANSEDKMQYNDSVPIIVTTTPNWTATTPYPEASYEQASSRYYELSRHMPAGTHMIWGTNLGFNNTDNAVAQALAIVATFSRGGAAHAAGVALDAIEIGNEADLYISNGLRPSNWTFDNWVSEWSLFAHSIIDAAGLKPNATPRLLTGSFSSSSHSTTTKFSPQRIIASSILSGTLGPYIDTVSQHQYSGSFCTGSGGLLASLMDKATIKGNVTVFSSDIAAVQAAGRDYIFGETNSYSCHGAPGVSDTAGAAIWTLDYALQAASTGIRKVFFHDGVGFKYNLIQPVTLYRDIETGQLFDTPLPPHVQPQYYAAVIAASLIGPSYGDKEIAEITIPNAEVSGYGAYENGVLKRAVFINHNAYLTSTTTPRGSVALGLGFESASRANPSKVEVRRLDIQYADDKSGLKFAGRSYETSTGLPNGRDTFILQKLNDPLVVQDTQAVLVTFL
ncbi:glycoside hydrolase family 79 protein [Clavulina sp. PMI_390]|nr:glycoside hydrolase family 79 protein [Clavulina sp. PMI_390]